MSLLLIPDASPLIGMLMLGNFLRECKVTERLVQASQNEIINIVTSTSLEIRFRSKCTGGESGRTPQSPYCPYTRLHQRHICRP